MKNIFFIFIFVTIIFQGDIFSQGEANVWYFGHGAGLDFNSGTPVALTNGSLHTDEGCSSISDAAGNILFYTDGDTVWNSSHAVMTNGTGLMGHNSTTQSAQIVPKPGNANIYYIFTADVGGGANGLRYSEVDMTLSGGLGAITANKNILLHTPVTEKIIAVKQQNCADVWLISHDASNTNFLAFSITPAGVNPVPVVSAAGTLAHPVICFGQLKASPDGTKLAQALYWEGKVDVLNFNKTTGTITLDFTIPTLFVVNQPYGVEFSPDGSKLYVTSSSYIDIYQYNLTLVAGPAVIASATNIGSVPPTDYLAGLQVGPDGKIYVAKWHGLGNGSGHGAIGCINNPNTLGTGCNYVDNQVNLLGKKCEMSFPIHISTKGANVLLTTNDTICNGSNYTLPGGAVVNTSGTYIDTLNTLSGCDSIITTNLSVVNAFTLLQNATICAGQNYTLPGGATVNTSGIYHDTITTSGNCDTIITTTLTVNPATTINKSDTICTGANYILPGGDTVTTAGVYNDTLQTLAGCDSVVITALSVSPNISVSQSINICDGQSYTLPGGTAVTVAGNYIDTLTSQGGCDSIITTTVILKPNSTFSQNATICSNQTYTLPSGTQTNISGIYSDTLTASNGCDSIVSTTLTVNIAPTTNITGTTNILTGQSTTLTAIGGGTYSWSPSAGLDNTTNNIVNANPTQTTIYCVEVTSSNGCKDTSCITVTVELPCPKAENLAVPNAFSPNGDNVNDEFCLQGWDMCVEEFSITIFNRWGEKVFESIDPQFCWQGEKQDAGVFVYYIRAKFLNIPTMINKKGNISLIK